MKNGICQEFAECAKQKQNTNTKKQKMVETMDDFVCSMGHEFATKNPTTCPICGTRTLENKKERQLGLTQKDNRGRIIYRCGVCGRKFAFYASIKEHYKKYKH